MHLDAPNIGKLEKEFLNNAVDSGYVSTVGPYVSEFEEKFLKYLRVKKAVSVQNGTVALHISLYELGIKAGDEVIVPALTFVASVNPIMYVGATPVFVDIDPRTWNIDAGQIEKAITKDTKAIMPVHFYGNPCNMDEIMRIAEEYDLRVIEDATESLGARYKGRYTGTFGDFGCFSFNGNKIITSGGGGMVAGNNKKRLERIKFLINQARDESRGYYHPEIGFNYRMTNIQAALGLAQMKRLEDFLKKKKEFNAIYRKELRGLDFISFQEESRDSESSWWMTCVAVEKNIDIVRLQGELGKKQITTRRVFMPVTEFPPYMQYKNSDFKNSYHVYDRGLCLPSSTLNSKNDVLDVCRIIKETLREKL